MAAAPLACGDASLWRPRGPSDHSVGPICRARNTSNVFAMAPQNEDPFDDPSIRSAVAGGDIDDLESNPFETTSLKQGDSGYAPQVDLDEQEEIYPTSTHGTAPANAMRMDDIARREREIEERERELDARTERMRRFGRNNWPPFYPIVYHDIAGEIPPDSQWIMKDVYRLWLLLAATLVWNFVTCLLLLIITGAISDLIMGAFYMVFIGTGSFFLWYRPLYFGLMKEHSFFYYVFFLFCGCHLLFSIYAFVGVAAAGCAGALTTIHWYVQRGWKGWLFGTFSLITTLGFFAQGVGLAWYYRIIWRHNHDKGHTFDQAKAELASHGMRAYLMNSARI